MNAVKVSPKYQVVIPAEIRKRLKVRPGMRLRVIRYQGQIVMIPLRPIRQLRGFAKGIDTTVERDEEDRL